MKVSATEGVKWQHLVTDLNIFSIYTVALVPSSA